MTELRRQGSIFPGADVIIAQAAVGHRAILLHADADFDRIAQYQPLQVESYVEEVRRA